MSDVTQLLNSGDVLQHSDARANELLSLVYDELRKLAAHKMAHERPGQTLQPTALVHEAWLRLSGSTQQSWNDRSHFFGAAAEAMRRILIDRARRKLAARHGAGQECLNLDELEIAAPSTDDELLAVSDALERFEKLDLRKAQLVKLRYFAGLTNEEAAPLLAISVPTAKRWWTYARAWLYQQIQLKKL
jgi:RNA polymerase sigma factor (TIGR02999 family)